MNRDEYWQVEVMLPGELAGQFLFRCQGHATECYRNMLDADNVESVTIIKPRKWVRDPDD